MMCPPHRVKMVSTPSFFSALATRWPPEITLASRIFRCSVSSAVVALVGLEMGLTVAILSPDALNEAGPQVFRTGAAPAAADPGKAIRLLAKCAARMGL